MSEHITSILKKKIKEYQAEVHSSIEGKVIAIADGIATVSGLQDVQSGELLKFTNDTLGIALNLEEDVIGVILLDSYEHINEGDPVKRTKKITEIGVGDQLLGRIINPLGQVIDGKEEIKFDKYRPIEKVAPGIMTRQSVNEPLETGILSIDSIIPIGKGQRELIIGDKKTGKTSIAIDSILNQKGKNVKAVYVSIGQKNSTLANTVQILIDGGAMEYTTIVAANASDLDAMQYIAPFAGMAIAEEWMEKGEDVLIVFDDLTKHAVAYRAVSLLLRRPPGREAYPGDVFYLHSRLLERAGKLNDDYGGGSITAFPIIETQAGDIAAYIPTNVISITDGQIFLMVDAFNAGQRPAIDAGLSVSRVGSAAQTKLMKKVSGSLKLILANYEEIKAFTEFSSESDESTKKIIENGLRVMKLLKQPVNSPLSQEIQSIILFGISKKMFLDVPLEKIDDLKSEIIKDNKKFDFVINDFKTTKVLNEETEKRLESILQELVKKYSAKSIENNKDSKENDSNKEDSNKEDSNKKDSKENDSNKEDLNKIDSKEVSSNKEDSNKIDSKEVSSNKEDSNLDNKKIK